MKIALVKPDWGIRGGFEVVAERVLGDLVGAGHDVERVEVRVASLPRTVFGVPVDDAAWARAAEWFTHVALLEAFRSLDLRWADVVISTQPPSYGVRHPRHLALFYHHARAFYDLEDVWVAAGRAPQVLHRAGAAMLRDIEAEDLAGVTHFLAGSPRVAERLRRYQGQDVPLSLYGSAAPTVQPGDDGTYEDVLTISRHEFTKRTELVVQALALSGARGTLVGDGGRLPFVRGLASSIASGRADAAALRDEDLWLNLGTSSAGEPVGEVDGVRVAGRLDDDELAGLLRRALCVVAPAYDEDDGLTVLEAMAHARPVIVCRDGGGLTALVEDGVNGFVVEPTGEAIAEAIGRLTRDPELARRMGLAGRETVRERTPERARRQLLDAVELVAGSRR